VDLEFRTNLPTASKLINYGIVNPSTDRYLISLQKERDSVLHELELDAEKNSVPIVGPLVGKFLSIIAKSCNAENILEIGTATGYSAIWLARSFQNGHGKLLTIEYDRERMKQAEQNFKRAGLSGIIEIIPGKAQKIVPYMAKSRPAEFDLVFLDVGEKTLYVELLQPCLELLRVGGFLAADNTLWNGWVADSSNKNEETEIIRRFNEKVFKNEKLDASIVPLRDGVLVALKRR